MKMCISFTSIFFAFKIIGFSLLRGASSLEEVSEAALTNTSFGGHFDLVVVISSLRSSTDSDKTCSIYITKANILSTQTCFSNHL